MPFGGNNLKYIIPIELTTPESGRMSFYTGLYSPTEQTVGVVFQPDVNDVSGYQNKLFQLVFGTFFSRGSGTAGYVCGVHSYFRYTSSPTNASGNTSGQLWKDFTIPKVLYNQMIDVSAQTYSQNKNLKGFLLVYDTAHTGDATQKALTDAGMNIYFSLTDPTA